RCGRTAAVATGCPISVRMNAFPTEERAAIGPASDTGRFSRFAVGALALTFIVVVASAYMRHAQSVGCADWPSCYGRTPSDVQAAAPSIGVHLARILHRLAASAALLAIAMLLVFSWRRSDVRRARALAASALAVALGLAALGI